VWQYVKADFNREAQDIAGSLKGQYDQSQGDEEILHTPDVTYPYQEKESQRSIEDFIKT